MEESSDKEFHNIDDQVKIHYEEYVFFNNLTIFREIKNKEKKEKEKRLKTSSIIQTKGDRLTVLKDDEQNSMEFEDLDLRIEEQKKKDAAIEMKFSVDPNIEKWLDIHFYGGRIKRVKTSEWSTEKSRKRKYGPTEDFLGEQKHGIVGTFFLK